MADRLQSLTRTLLNEPGLVIETGAGYGAAVPEHRRRLREAVRDRLLAMSRDDVPIEIPADVFDLSKPLTGAAGLCVSISHANPFGGFALSKNPVGFDVEEPSRVQRRTIARVSKDSELNEAPGLAWLWAAKEAAFKGLQHAEKKPEVLSQIEIGGWVLTDGDSQSGTFLVRNLSDFSSRAALGCVIASEEMIVSTFSIAP